MVEVAEISDQGTSDGCGCREDRRTAKATSRKKLYLETYGYTVRRANGKGGNELVVTRNAEPAKGA